MNNEDRKYNYVNVDSIIMSPERVIKELFHEKELHQRFLASTAPKEFSTMIMGVEVSTDKTPEELIDKFYKEAPIVLEEQDVNDLAKTRFRNTKCAVEHLRRVYDLYKYGNQVDSNNIIAKASHKATEEDVNLFLSRVILNMQMSYNMLNQPGIGVDLDFNQYIDNFCKIASKVEQQASSGKIPSTDRTVTAVNLITQVKNSPVGHEIDALRHICDMSEEESYAQVWLEEFSTINKNKTNGIEKPKLK